MENWMGQQSEEIVMEVRRRKDGTTERRKRDMCGSLATNERHLRRDEFVQWRSQCSVDSLPPINSINFLNQRAKPNVGIAFTTTGKCSNSVIYSIQYKLSILGDIVKFPSFSGRNGFSCFPVKNMLFRSRRIYSCSSCSQQWSIWGLCTPAESQL